VLDLEKAKTAQANEITDLKKRVKKLERKKKSRTLSFKRLWKVGSTTRVESSEDKESLEAFVPMDTKLEKGSDKAVEDSEKAEEGSSKRAGSNLEQEMWNDVMLQVDYEVEMTYDLLRLIRKQINEGYAIEKRFGGNAATKKTQRNLLKQQHENFTASSSKVISQEDVNHKFLRSLSPEWNTHTIVWMNKPEIDTLSLDDLYNNLKIYEPKVKGASSLNSNTQNVAFVSSNSTSSTNRALKTTHGATNASTQATTINSTTIDNLSDVVICSFFVSQPNCPHLNNEDLQQIYPDDLEEMDLRRQMAMLTMRAKRFLKNTGRKFFMNGNKTIGINKTKVKCFNFHKKGHFARECRAPRSQENKNRENTKRNVPVETPASRTLVFCDGLGGYD
nr:hypothetical protein [Tanacetum cinerariifolium]